MQAVSTSLKIKQRLGIARPTVGREPRQAGRVIDRRAFCMKRACGTAPRQPAAPVGTGFWYSDMISVFVSYRREDSLHQSGRLYDRLVAHFGSEQIFKDVDSIPLGLYSREILSERVAGCDVFLAVIGDAWLSITGKSGTRRLDDPADFVRIKVEAALGRKIPVIPVLVGNSSVPPAEELPESLRGLSFRHGLRVRPDLDFHNDMHRLIRGIEEGVAALRKRSASGGPRTPGPEDPTPAAKPGAEQDSMILPKVITNTIGMKLVLIPAGEILMGSPDSDPYALPREKPQHRVRIARPFACADPTGPLRAADRVIRGGGWNLIAGFAGVGALVLEHSGGAGRQPGVPPGPSPGWWAKKGKRNPERSLEGRKEGGAPAPTGRSGATCPGIKCLALGIDPFQRRTPGKERLGLRKTSRSAPRNSASKY